MRQRRSSLPSTTTRSIHHDQRRRSSHAAFPMRVSRNSLTSLFTIILSGTIGFVFSTCTLLLLLSPYLERRALFYTTSSNLIPQQDLSLPHWEWHIYYGNSRNQTLSQGNTSFTPKHLIVQISTSPLSKNHATRDYLTASNDLELLAITSRVNRAYAKKWRIDYAKVDFPRIWLTGDELISPLNNNIQGKFSIQKCIGISQYIGLLRDIIHIGQNGTSQEIDVSTDDEISNHSASHLEHQYDFVWIFIDPSIMVVDFEKSIFEQSDFLLTSLSGNTAAFNVDSFDVRGHNSMMNAAHSIINEGALLWNLNHQHISHFLNSWGRLKHLGDALSSEQRLTKQAPLWREIPDDKSRIYHLQFESVKMLSNSITNNERSQDYDSQTQEELNHYNKTREENHVSASREDRFLPNPPFSMIEPDEFQIRAIKLQSVADLVCFRYFPSCDIL